MSEQLSVSVETVEAIDISRVVQEDENDRRQPHGLG
jgi:hypothetical protein